MYKLAVLLLSAYAFVQAVSSNVAPQAVRTIEIHDGETYSYETYPMSPDDDGEDFDDDIEDAIDDDEEEEEEDYTDEEREMSIELANLRLAEFRAMGYALLGPGRTTLLDDMGYYFTSPMFPSNYPDGSKEKWVLTPSSTSNLTCYNIRIKKSKKCKKDKLTLFTEPKFIKGYRRCGKIDRFTKMLVDPFKVVFRSNYDWKTNIGFICEIPPSQSPTLPPVPCYGNYSGPAVEVYSCSDLDPDYSANVVCQDCGDGSLAITVDMCVNDPCYHNVFLRHRFASPTTAFIEKTCSGTFTLAWENSDIIGLVFRDDDDDDITYSLSDIKIYAINGDPSSPCYWPKCGTPRHCVNMGVNVKRKSQASGTLFNDQPMQMDQRSHLSTLEHIALSGTKAECLETSGNTMSPITFCSDHSNCVPPSDNWGNIKHSLESFYFRDDRTTLYMYDYDFNLAQTTCIEINAPNATSVYSSGISTYSGCYTSTIALSMPSISYVPYCNFDSLLTSNTCLNYKFLTSVDCAGHCYNEWMTDHVSLNNIDATCNSGGTVSSYFTGHNNMCGSNPGC